MKAVLGTSIACSAASLIGIAGLSAMSVVPAAEARRRQWMVVVSALLVAWLLLSIWAGWRLRSPGKADPFPACFEKGLAVFGVLYVIAVLLFTVG